MWFPLSTVTAALCVLMDTAVDVAGASSASAEDAAALEVTFSERTRADWEKVWHQESHSRCRDKLIRHLYWACEKDIYRISRRNDDYGGGGGSMGFGAVGKRANALPFLSRWTISQEQAQSFLRTRRTGKRRSGGSITAECCTRVGCTWEEYAEYCPSNKRINRYRK